MLKEEKFIIGHGGKISRMIIGISGKMGAGKDTLGDILCDLEPKYEVKRFSDKLKMIASLLSGISAERFESQDFKQLGMPSVWNKHNSPTTPYGDQHIRMSVREFLQKIGTEAMRDNLHEDVWVNALFADYKERYYGSKNMPNWVITDVRFPNEANAILNRGGVMVKINRTDTTGINRNHSSETALDGWRGFSYVIDNNGTLEDLILHADSILKLECL